MVDWVECGQSRPESFWSNSHRSGSLSLSLSLCVGVCVCGWVGVGVWVWVWVSRCVWVSGCVWVWVWVCGCVGWVCACVCIKLQPCSQAYPAIIWWYIIQSTSKINLCSGWCSIKSMKNGSFRRVYFQAWQGWYQHRCKTDHCYIQWYNSHLNSLYG